MKRWYNVFFIMLLLSGCTVYSKGNKDIIEDVEETSDVIADSTPYDFSKMTLSDIMEDIREIYQLDETNFSMFYENTVTQESYSYHEESLMLGASTIKVLVNMMVYEQEYDIENTHLLLTVDAYEEGAGYTVYDYAFGEYIPLSYLMEQSIVYSDNTAINIIMEELGFQQVREALASYGDMNYPEEFYYENLINAQLLHAILKQLYENQENYGDLIMQMMEALPNRLMKGMLLDVPIAHKYGEYGTYLHDFGIVYAQEPFLMGILSNDVENSEEMIAYITNVLYEYQSYHQNHK